MFAEPQTVTINAVAKTLPRIVSDRPTRKGVFSTADGEFSYSVAQDSTTNRFRREIRLSQKKVAADPISAVNKEVSASVMIVVDEPRWGFTDGELGFLLAGLISNFQAGTNANRDKLLGGEI